MFAAPPLCTVVPLTFTGHLYGYLNGNAGSLTFRVEWTAERVRVMASTASGMGTTLLVESCDQAVIAHWHDVISLCQQAASQAGGPTRSHRANDPKAGQG